MRHCADGGLLYAQRYGRPVAFDGHHFAADSVGAETDLVINGSITFSASRFGAGSAGRFVKNQAMRKLILKRLMLMSATLGLAINVAFAQSPPAGDVQQS